MPAGSATAGQTREGQNSGETQFADGTNPQETANGTGVSCPQRCVSDTDFFSLELPEFYQTGQ